MLTSYPNPTDQPARPPLRRDPALWEAFAEDREKYPYAPEGAVWVTVKGRRVLAVPA